MVSTTKQIYNRIRKHSSNYTKTMHLLASCEDEVKREVALINKELRAVVVKMRGNFFKLSVE